MMGEIKRVKKNPYFFDGNFQNYFFLESDDKNRASCCVIILSMGFAEEVTQNLQPMLNYQKITSQIKVNISKTDVTFNSKSL